MSRLAIVLFVLAFAVVGLTSTALAQQDPSTDPSVQQDGQPQPAAQQDQQPQPEHPVTACQTDRILVKVLPGADPAEVIARYGGTIIHTIPDIDIQVVTVPAGTGLKTIDALNADPDVKYAEADHIVKATSVNTAGC
jgi:hypothetical protein